MLFLSSLVVAQAEPPTLTVGSPCMSDRDHDGACDDRNPDRSATEVYRDDDRDGSPNDVDCAPDLAAIRPGIPEIDDGMDNDCDGAIPSSEQRGPHASSDDLRLVIRDRGQWRSSPRDSDYSWGCSKIVEIPGPGGTRAWACSSSDCDAGWGGGTCTASGWSWILRPSGERGLDVVARVDLPGRVSAAVSKPEGVFSLTDKIGYPTPAERGFRTGSLSWRWSGDTLRPVLASPRAELAPSRVSDDGLWFEVENCSAAPVDLSGLVLQSGARWSGIRPLERAAIVPPRGRAVIRSVNADDIGEPAPLAVVEDGEPETHSERILWAGRRPLARIVAGAVEPDPCGAAASAGAAAVDVIRAYYASIEARDYEAAFGRWEQGASHQTLETFTRGFAETAHTAVEIGTPGPALPGEGGAIVTVPVEVRATLRSGVPQRFVGWYAVRGSDRVPWSLHAAQLSPAP